MRLAIPEKIETARLFLRPLRYEDAEEIFYVYASKADATRFVSWPMHQTIEDTRAFLRETITGWEKGTDYSFGIRKKENGRFIGSFGMLNDQGKIQFGYILGPLHWGNGYATEVCQAMLKILKELPVYRIGTFIDSENVASARVLLKSGLVEEARLPAWFRFVNQGNEAKDCTLFRYPLSPADLADLREWSPADLADLRK
jgi:ribosomal-protein-alanine N-acetyltransferase